jgi:hypothetical protein
MERIRRKAERKRFKVPGTRCKKTKKEKKTGERTKGRKEDSHQAGSDLSEAT